MRLFQDLNVSRTRCQHLIRINSCQLTCLLQTININSRVNLLEVSHLDHVYFVRGLQYNDNCDKYSAISDRKGQLTAQEICFICLRVGHVCKECPSAQIRSCYYYNRIGHHHCSIGPKQFGRSISGSSGGDQALVSPQDDNSQTSVISSETDVDSTSSSKKVTLSHALMAHREKVVLQTAKVVVYGNDGTKVTANLLSDNVS